MYSNSFTEDDWKLFKKKIPQWQETYMTKLNKGYFYGERITDIDGEPT